MYSLPICTKTLPSRSATRRTPHSQNTLTPKESAKKYGWKDDLQKAARGMLSDE